MMLWFAGLVFLVTLFGVSTRLTTAQAFTDKELQCFLQQKVLHSDGKCYALHQQGPCPGEQWLVYEETEVENSSPRTVCRTRKCNTRDRPILWPEDGECHRLSDRKTLCPYEHNQLKSDSYGNGECACESKHARYETEVLNMKKVFGDFAWEGDCYHLFYRGPCPRGQLMYPKVLEGFGLVGRCMDDYCADLNNASSPDISYVMRKEDLKCYRLGTIGPPCGSTQVYNVHPLTHLPECYGFTTTLYTDSTVRCGGAANINQLTGECRQRVFLQAQTFGFDSTRKKAARRRGRR